MQHEPFDAYRKWLGIAPKDQPPNLYRLLGVDLFETDSDVIANASDQRMNHLRTFQTGPHANLSQRILNEISTAKIRLLDPQKRAEYDKELREQLNGVGAAPAAPPPKRSLAPVAAPAEGKPSASGIRSAQRGTAAPESAPPARPASQSGILSARSAAPPANNSPAAEGAEASSSAIGSAGISKPERPGAPPPKRNRAAATVVGDEFPLNGGSVGDFNDDETSTVADVPAVRQMVPPRPSAAVQPSKGRRTSSSARWFAIGGIVITVALLLTAAFMFVSMRARRNSAENEAVKNLQANGTEAPAILPGETPVVLNGGKDAPVKPLVGGKDPTPPARREKDAPAVTLPTPPPPQLAEVRDQTILQGAPLTLELPTDGAPLGREYEVRLDDPPAGAAVDPISGQLRWEPGADVAPGEYSLNVKVVRRAGEEVVSRRKVLVHVLPGLGETDGRGLRAELFANAEMTELRGVQLDRRLDGFWVNAAPSLTVSPGQFGVRWTGWIRAPQAGHYALRLLGSGGGARLWLDDKLLYEIPSDPWRWKLQTEATLDRKPHALRVEFTHRAGSAMLALHWTRPDGVEEIVPATALFHKLQVAQTDANSVPPAPALSGKAGMQVEFFRDDDFNDRIATSAHRSLSEVWGTGKNFRKAAKTIRWSGTLTAPQVGKYQLIVVHDGPVRLWLGESLLIDAWQSHGLTRAMAEAELDDPVPLRIEYACARQGASNALSLRWRPPAAGQDDLIPASALSHDPNRPPGVEPIPQPEDLAAAVEAIKLEFAADYASKGSDARLAVANKLRLAATGHLVAPQRRFALLTEARDLAAGQGDLAASWKAIDLMQRYFDVDPVEVRARALQSASAAVHDLEGYRRVAESYLAVLQIAYRTGHFLEGVELIRPTLTATERCKDREMRKEASRLSKQLREISAEEVKAVDARKILATDPKSGFANYVLGRFLAVYQQNWSAGLPLLALGSNQSYKAAATADLLQPSDAHQQKHVGDLWWEVQKLESDQAREQVRRRAQRWYSLASRGLRGPDAKKVNSRLGEIQQSLAAPSPQELAADSGRELAAGPHLTTEPLDPSATRKLVQLVLESHGEVRIQERNGWIREVKDLPKLGNLTVTALHLNGAADDAAMQGIGRLPSLEDLAVESPKITDTGVRRLQDLVLLKKLRLVAPHLSDKSLSALERLTALETLTLGGDQFGTGMSSLKSMKELRRLDITGDRIADVAFVAFGQLPNLEVLNLTGGRYSPAATEHLQSLKKLVKLRLRSTSVTDGVALRISKIKSLKELTVEGPVGRAGVASLAKLELERLSITSAMISDADLEPLGRMTQLTRLHLATRPISDGGLGRLSTLTNLVVLDIQTASAVTNVGLGALSPLTMLRSVRLGGTHFTSDSYRKFKAEHNGARLSTQSE